MSPRISPHLPIRYEPTREPTGRHRFQLELQRQRRLLVCALVAALLLPACGEKTTPEQDFKAAWQAADIEVTDLVKLADSPIGGETCWSCKAAEIETIFCQYKDAKAAAQAHSSGLRHVGEDKGLALNRGRWMIVVTDRDGIDKKGKRMNRIANAFLSSKRVQEKPKKKKGQKGKGDNDR